MYQSRWGWHPCAFETFLLLKELNRHCERARRAFADWQRWARKAPQNRVIRQRIYDDQGRRCGTRVVGPRPEPPLMPLFCERHPVIRHRRRDGQVIREETACVRFQDHGIPAAYRQARQPLPSAAAVQTLPLGLEQIRSLLERARAGQ
jgi:hypothetical protein